MFVEHKEASEITEQTHDLFTLSGLIRAGCLLHPQGTGLNFHDGKTCAIGAAWMAAGQPDWLQFCGVWIQRGVDLTNVFVRNDAGETREAIADWLESQGY